MSELWSKGGKNTSVVKIGRVGETGKIAVWPGVMIVLWSVFERLIWKVKLNETPMKSLSNPGYS